MSPACDPLALRLRCNDHDTGWRLGSVDAIDVYAGTVCLVSVERYGKPLVCTFDGALLYLGNLIFVAPHHAPMPDDRAWECMALAPALLPALLALLACTGWHWRKGTPEGAQWWAAAGGVVPEYGQEQ